MAYFNKENRSGGDRGYGKRSFSNDRPDMHKATCANCGKLCEVPFRPTGSKPVFCRDCFKTVEGADSRGSDTGRGSENRSFGRSNSEERQMFDAVCSSCGNNCQIPFRPSQGREVFCSRCFEKNEGSSDTRRPERRSFDRPSFNREDTRSRPTQDTPNYKAQFEALNAKMDRILNLLTPKVAPLESVIDDAVLEEIVEEVEESKAEAVEKKPKKVKATAKKAVTKVKKSPAKKK